mgnify:FL=1
MNKCRTELQKLRKKQEAYQAAIGRFQNKIADVQNQMLKICLEVTEESNRASKEEKRYLSTKEVCDMLGVSDTTLYRMRLEQNLPFVKVAGKRNVRFDKEEVIKFMNEQKQRWYDR